MTPRGYRVLGYLLIAAAMLLLVPTIREIRMFGFDLGMIMPLLCSPVVCLSSLFYFRKAGKLEREQQNKKEK